VNRVQKVLEGANIKLASVASDVLGVTGRAMLEEENQVRIKKDPFRDISSPKFESVSNPSTTSSILFGSEIELRTPITAGSACTPARSGPRAHSHRWWQYKVPLHRSAPYLE
jgi:hypothetical protein